MFVNIWNHVHARVIKDLGSDKALALKQKLWVNNIVIKLLLTVRVLL